MTEKVVIDIEGMSCGGCVKSVQTALDNLTGVEHHDVSLSNNQAVVELDTAKVAVQQVLDTIEAAGFDAKVAHS